MTADFQRLNVLLLRAVTGKMIGTALLTEAKVHATFDETVTASGSLGGLQVNNLLLGSSLHQRIISVGKDPVTEEFNRIQCPNIHSQLYSSSSNNLSPSSDSGAQGKHAFTFRIDQQYVVRAEHGLPVASAVSTPINEKLAFSDQPMRQPKTQRIDVELRLATVCYLHSGSFLKELNSCAADFIAFLSNLASSIRSAATDLALGIVQRRTESISHQVTMDETYGTPLKHYPSLPRRSGSFRNDPYSSWDRRAPPRILAPAPTPRMTANPSPLITHLEIRLDVVLETPVLVLPRHERSSEVLVAHLGMITVKNDILTSAHALQNEAHLPAGTTRVDRLSVKVKDMNVHSMDLVAKVKALKMMSSTTKKKNLPNVAASKAEAEFDQLEVVTAMKRLTAEELYSCASKVAVPILHDTAVELCLDLVTRKGLASIRESESYNSFMMDDLDQLEQLDQASGSTLQPSEKCYQFRGKVMNPLKLSLYRGQYELLMESLKKRCPEFWTRARSAAAAAAAAAASQNASSGQTVSNAIF